MMIKSLSENLLANLIWVVLVATVTAAMKYNDVYGIYDIVVVLAYIALVIIFLWHKNRYQKVTGICKVDPQIAKGLQPVDALKSCKNNFKFLGIAANKFIFASEFEAAVRRCNRTGDSIKFLLSSPENPIIVQMARRAKRGEDDFRNMINSTLKKLKMLTEDHGYNIEVRLYRSTGDSGPPSFRLFFVDNTEVLVSYYLMGEGDGSLMPQLLIKKPVGKSEVNNFYFAFDHYFNSLWAESMPCDFSKIS